MSHSGDQGVPRRLRAASQQPRSRPQRSTHCTAASSEPEPIQAPDNQEVAVADASELWRQRSGPAGRLSQLQSYEAPDWADLLSHTGSAVGSRVGRSEPCSAALASGLSGPQEVEPNNSAHGLSTESSEASPADTEASQHGFARSSLPCHPLDPQAAAAGSAQVSYPPLQGLSAWMRSFSHLSAEIHALSDPGHNLSSSDNVAASAPGIESMQNCTPMHPALPGPWRTAAESFGGPPVLLELAGWLRSHHALPSQIQNVSACSSRMPHTLGQAAAAWRTATRARGGNECRKQGSLPHQSLHAVKAALSKPSLQAPIQQDWRWLVSDLRFTQQVLLAWARMQASPRSTAAGPCLHTRAPVAVRELAPSSSTALHGCQEWAACQMSLAALCLHTV